MSKPQIITTPGGETLVVLPIAEYEALIDAASEAEEEAADIAAYDEAKAALAAEASGGDLQAHSEWRLSSEGGSQMAGRAAK